MKKYLFIAEKPSLMRTVRSVYEKHKTEVNHDIGLIDFVALAGHVCRLIEPSEYPEWNEKWADIRLPMIPKDFKIDTIPSKKNIIQDIKKRIKENSYDGIIVGTDADVEGNGIYYLLEHYLGIEKIPAYRFFEQDQTDKAILKSLHSLTDFHKNPRDIHMTDAYKIRSHMDWLIGMNFTVGFTVKSGFTMKVGRVKAPTLKLVYDNCNAIDNFVPHTDYAVESVYENEKNPFTGILIDQYEKEIRFKTAAEADTFIKKCSKSGCVSSIKKEIVKTYAPQLYKLSDIQSEAGKLYGFTPGKVTDLVQSLYEKKIISYPRTSGRYISSEKAKEFPVLLKAVAAVPELKPYAEAVTKEMMDQVKANKKIVNDEEVKKSSHDALLPTGFIPGAEKLNVDEEKIRELIFKRFLAVFLPPLSEEKTTVIIQIDSNSFKTIGKTVINKGWKELYKSKLEETKLPDLKKGDQLTIKEFHPLERTTTPPNRLTQPTLIEAMENIQKYIDDKELKDVMKVAKGIGMESSRASIIADLIKSGYIESKGKSMALHITDIGRKYMENILDFSVSKPELTAEWESKMQEIQEGTKTYNEVETEMLQYVKDVVSEIASADIKKESFKSKNETGIMCPVCGKELILGKFGYFCSGRKEGCTFTVSDAVAGKKLTKKNINDLCSKGQTDKIKGFTSKAGKKFDAKLKLVINGESGSKRGNLEFIFDEHSSVKKIKQKHKCPICLKPLASNRFALECSECGLTIGYKIAGHELTDLEIRDLLEYRKTRKIRGFVSKAGRTFDATLILDENGMVKFDFS